MQDVLTRCMEWYLGLPAAEPGQVSRWSITARSPWPSHGPSVLAWLLTAGLALWVIEIYRRDARSLLARQRATLIALRALTLSLVLLLMSQVSVSIERTGLPLVIVLLATQA